MFYKVTGSLTDHFVWAQPALYSFIVLAYQTLHSFDAALSKKWESLTYGVKALGKEHGGELLKACHSDLGVKSREEILQEQPCSEKG